MKKAKTVCLCLLLALGIINISAVKAQVTNNDIIKNDSTGIPDRVLYELVLEFGDENGDGILTKGEAKEIYKLHSWPGSNKIKNIKGIDYLSNLRELVLNNNQITNIEPLKNLKYLTKLSIYSNKISNISPLTNLIYINDLDISDNNIKDISPLYKLTKIINLTMYGNEIEDISPIQNMKQLCILDFSYNNVRDISGLKNLKNLHGLFFDDNKVSNIDVVKALTQLEYLKASDNYLKSLPDLRGLKNLESDRTRFNGNLITETELKSKMPKHLATNQGWLSANRYVPLNVENLKAKASGVNKITLNWNNINKADGYRVYRRIGNGKYEYRATVTTSKFVDTTASNAVYNYYRVYPIQKIKGTTVVGKSGNYSCAKGLNIKPTGVTLNVSNKVITLGNTGQFKVIVKPTNANPTVTWRSSNTKVASVDKNGKVSAKAVGTAYIYAKTINGKEIKATVKVIPKPISVKLNYSNKVVTLGKTIQFKATVNPSNANQAVAWRSSDAKIASVDKNGKVSAKAVGTAYIYAKTINGKEIRATVKVIPQPISVKLNNTKKVMKKGTAYTFKATVNPSNANQAITWRIGNNKIATVDKNGKVIAKSEGLTWLYAKTINGKEIKCLIKVVK